MPGQCRCIFLQNTALKDEFRPKRAKTKPRGCKITKIWPYMAPKGTQFEPKGHQNDPKGCQRGAKSEPEIRRHRPVSGVSDKRSQLAKRRLRRLALLTSRRPPGESKWLQKTHFSRPFSDFSRPFPASNFNIIFGMPFFRHFTPFGAPLAPLWLLLGILDAFWPPFWLPFGSLLLQICIPFSNLVFASILH